MNKTRKIRISVTVNPLKLQNANDLRIDLSKTLAVGINKLILEIYRDKFSK